MCVDNPGGQKLQDVVPPDLYARWLPLKARYLGRDEGVESWRPIFAAQELYRAALKQKSLVPYDGIWPAVEKLARKAKVPIVETEIELKVEKARASIKEFKTTPLDDVECFARTLQRLESDLGLMRERANAWAVGDVARLRRWRPSSVPVRASAWCSNPRSCSSGVRRRSRRAESAWVRRDRRRLIEIRRRSPC